MALSQAEINKRHYRKRKDNGLCPRCGKKLDRKGHYCTNCVEKHNEYQRDTKRLLRSIGICPECRKEKLFGDERTCLECQANAYSRKHPTEEQRKRYNEKFKIQQKELYKIRSEKGICTRCGKFKAKDGAKKCEICLEKNAALHRQKYLKKQNERLIRKLNNLCYQCGEPLDETAKTSFCKKCYEKCCKNLEKAREKSPWGETNQYFFKK